MKTYLMSVTAYRFAIVKAENEDEALEKMGDDFSMGDWELDSMKMEQELTTSAQVSNKLRHGATMID